MSSFSQISGRQRSSRILSSFIRSQQIPNALLFSGISGIGKMAAAVDFAKALNCRNLLRPTTESDTENGQPINACDECVPCRKISGNHHPDILTITPSGVSIKIEQIRELLHTLALKPVEAKWRVVMIKDADTMNPHAANALLKALEEPPVQTIFILLAGQASDLLPTIVSRCQQIRFSPSSIKEVEMYLTTQLGVSADNAPIVAALSNGSIVNAEKMVKNQWAEQRKWLLQEISGLAAQPPSVILALAEILAADRDRFLSAVEIIESWLRDIAVIGSAPEKIINKDLTDTIQYVSQGIAAGTIEKYFRAVRKANRDATGNANPRLAMETLLLELSTP